MNFEEEIIKLIEKYSNVKIGNLGIKRLELNLGMKDFPEIKLDGVLIEGGGK